MSGQNATIVEGQAREVPRKRWYRSTTDRTVAGVAGGLAEYLNVDVGVVRVLWLLSIFMTAGVTLVLYGVLAILIPEESAAHASQKTPAPRELWQRLTANRAAVWSAVLVFVGVLLLLNNFDLLPFRLEALWQAFWGLFMPLLLIGLGVLLLLRVTGHKLDWRRLQEARARLPLRRSRNDRVIAGVCGGLGQYLKVDPVLVRIGWAVLTVVTLGIGGILLYAVAALVLPLQE